MRTVTDLTDVFGKLGYDIAVASQRIGGLLPNTGRLDEGIGRAGSIVSTFDAVNYQVPLMLPATTWLTTIDQSIAAEKKSPAPNPEETRDEEPAFEKAFQKGKMPDVNLSGLVGEVALLLDGIEKAKTGLTAWGTMINTLLDTGDPVNGTTSTNEANVIVEMIRDSGPFGSLGELDCRLPNYLPEKSERDEPPSYQPDLSDNYLRDIATEKGSFIYVIENAHSAKKSPSQVVYDLATGNIFFPNEKGGYSDHHPNQIDIKEAAAAIQESKTSWDRQMPANVSSDIEHFTQKFDAHDHTSVFNDYSMWKKPRLKNTEQFKTLPDFVVTSGDTPQAFLRPSRPKPSVGATQLSPWPISAGKKLEHDNMKMRTSSAAGIRDHAREDGRTVQISLTKPLIENFTVNVQNADDSTDHVRRTVEEALIDILNSVSATF